MIKEQKRENKSTEIKGKWNDGILLIIVLDINGLNTLKGRDSQIVCLKLPLIRGKHIKFKDTNKFEVQRCLML